MGRRGGYPGRGPGLGVAAVVSAGAIAFGVAIGLDLILAFIAATGICLLSLGAVRADRLPTLFLASLGLLLTAYALFSRGAAYAGHYPIFVGEIVLGVGVLACVLRTGLPLMRSPLAWLLVVFMGWGALRTLPYVHEYGSAAIRDAAVWGYATFALLVGSCLERARLLWRVPTWYTHFARILPFGVLFCWVVTRYASTRIPLWPDSHVPVAVFKPGDGAVHLGGALAFVLLGLYPPGGRGLRESWIRWFWWAGWVAAAAIVAAASRSALLAILSAAVIVLAVRPRVSLFKPILAVVIVAAGLVVGDLSIQVRGGRALSSEQLRQNVVSIGDNQEAAGHLAGTVVWRLSWWRDILGYTVGGPYFWGGKGYGINLADDDGYQLGYRPTDGDRKLRSPHNGHLMILARSGVPGFALWALLQTCFGLSLARGYVRQRRLDGGWWPRVHVWILAYWAALMVNASFDVFLEGPQGAIWFWCVFGFGLAIVEAGKERLQHTARRVRVSVKRAQPWPPQWGASPVGAGAPGP
jgi:O-Antigen ligase